MGKLPSRIRQLRTEKGLSQQALASVLGTSKSSINMYERGEREPGVPMLLSMAAYFLVTVDYLVGSTDERTSSVSDEDADAVSALASRAKPLLPLPPDIAALNVLLRDAGEIIERTEDGYYTASTGFLSGDDLDFLKTSAVNALKTAVNMLARRRTLELRDALNGKRGTE